MELLSEPVMLVIAAVGSSQSGNAVPIAASATPVASPALHAMPPPATRPYVIVDIPAYNRRGPSPDEADRRLSARADDHRPAVVAPLPPPSLAGARLGGARTSVEGFDAAVTAVHDERIALLKQRIEQRLASNAPDAAETLRDLQARLRRAEDARSVSLRRGAAPEATAGNDEIGVVRDKPSPPRAAQGPSHARSMPAGRRERSASNSGPSVTRSQADAVVQPPSAPAAFMTASAPATSPALPRPAKSAESLSGASDMLHASAALQRADVLLANARQLLEPHRPGQRGTAAEAGPGLVSWSWASPVQQFVLALAALLIIGAAARTSRAPSLATLTGGSGGANSVPLR